MRQRLRDTEHLLRMALLFALGIAVFVVARAALVPDDFGRLGHYRAGALDDARSRPVVHAGRQVCRECHEDVVNARVGSRHAGIGCETCHAALGRHAEDPGAQAPDLPGPERCLGCHLAQAARPAAFPQVDETHSGGEACASCHSPHHPEVTP